MAFEVNLGKDRFTSLTSAISLTLHASARILPSDVDTCPTDPSHIEKQLRSNDLWISQTPELGFKFSIPGSIPIIPSFSAFVSRIEEILCSSKLWSDLGLVVLFKDCELKNYNQDNPPSVQLSFGIRKNLRQPSKTTNVRKAAVLDYHDHINAPSSIPTFLLSSIKVSLSFAYNNEPAQRYRPTFVTKPEILEYQYADEYISIMPYDEHKQDIIFLGPKQKKTEDFEDTETPTFDEELEELHGSEQSSSLLTSHHSTFGRQHEELYCLVTTGLESLLLGRSERTNQREKSLQNLSQLAPSVFSPGYYREMSQRSQLIPSIAKSISSMLKLPCYQSLVPKLNSLDASSTTQSIPADPANTRNTVKAALWCIAQKQLYKPQASQNLRFGSPRPLPKSQTGNYHQPRENGMITESQVAHMHNDDTRDMEYSPDVEEDLLGFSDPDETSCEMLSVAVSSSTGSLQFSQCYDDDDDDLLSEQFEENILSQTPFSDDLAFDRESEDDNDDMLCDYI